MLLLTDRAVLESPVPLIERDEARMLGIALRPATHLRLRRGLHADRAAYRKLKPWERYAVRVHALIRARPNAVLCMESAAVLLGLPLFGEPRLLHVFDPDVQHSQSFGDVRVHTSADGRDVTFVGGTPVTSLLDTTTDLARVLAPAKALATVDSALSAVQGGWLTLDELHQRCVSQQNSRGRARLRWTLEHADARAESPGESVSRAIIEWCGFEPPELQREFRYEGHLDRADFYFPGRRVIGESDGWGKYSLDEPEAAARLLAKEKRREDRLRRHGHPVARWDLADAWKVQPMASALRAAGLSPQHPTQPAMLATLHDRSRDVRAARRRA